MSVCRLQDMQRPLYMQPKDALEYGIIDGIVKSQKKKDGDQIIDHVPRLEDYGKDVSGMMPLASLAQLCMFPKQAAAELSLRHDVAQFWAEAVGCASEWTVRQSRDCGAGS